MAGGTEPLPTPETEHFWAGTREGELRIQHCNDCGRYYFYPRPFCRYCQSRNVEWRGGAGAGGVVSHIIHPRPLAPPPPETLPLDGRVRVEFERRGDQALPVFRLDGPVAA